MLIGFKPDSIAIKFDERKIEINNVIIRNI